MNAVFSKTLRVDQVTALSQKQSPIFAFIGIVSAALASLIGVSANANISGQYRCEVRECRMTRADQKFDFSQPHAGMTFSPCGNKMSKIKSVVIDGYIITDYQLFVSGRGYAKIWALDAQGKTVQYLGPKSDYGYSLAGNSRDTVYVGFNQSEGLGIFGSSNSPWIVELTMSCGFPN